ncbi:oxamate carbamoyltransferase subunit AllH family protein [Nocardioides abyssi]|uniref:DUF2877 domain-containing protein n=1 Tax=Nocardioides abyssi TaxID=3058370 RepID=A0ABT8ETQ8_9ACTN|nr:DUF2877 domain-containing protein [Nocardioides abyssi]MDN4161489.1 DUF2877 domain-containing protein [Nocardioides abyssi]
MPPSTSTRTRVAGAGTAALRRRLHEEPGTGEVVHAGASAVYVRLGDRVVGVSAHSAVHVPATIATALTRLPDVAVGSPAEVADGALHVAGLSVSVDRLVPTDLPRLPPEAADRLAAATPDLSHVLDQLPAEALDALAAGDGEAVAALLGRGDGLTPVGDDVVAGWLVAARATGRSRDAVADGVRRSAHRTTTLSATLLLEAVDGACLPQFRALLLTLATGRGVPDAVDRLVAVGHSSGAGMLLGAALALRS